jgi:hypothetical protein
MAVSWVLTPIQKRSIETDVRSHRRLRIERRAYENEVNKALYLTDVN